MLTGILAFVYMDWMYEAYNSVYHKLGEVLYDENIMLPLASLTLAILVCVAVWTMRSILAGHQERWLRGRRTMKLSRQQRYEDALVHGIEDSVFRGLMTRGQARARYREMAEYLKLPGLYLRVKEYKTLDKYAAKRLRDKTEAALADPAIKNVVPFPKEEKRKVITKPTLVTRLKTFAAR